MVKTETNPGWAAGIGQRSRVQQFGWALTGAPSRKKDLRLNALSAIAEGRKLRDRVTAWMRNEGVDPADARVYCVFTDSDAFRAPDVTDPYLTDLDVEHIPTLARLKADDGAGDLALVTRVADKRPIGFLIFVWDRNDWKQLIWSIRPLIVEDHSATTANAAAMRSEKQRIETKLEETAGVYPDNEDHDGQA